MSKSERNQRNNEATHHKLTVISHKDRDAFELLGRVCHVTREDLLSFISSNRISTYVKEGIIEKTIGGEFYRTTKSGKELIEEKTGIGCYSSNAPEHDQVLKEIYLSLSEQEQSSWLTERELSREYQDNDYSVCDAAYISEDTDELICVEIVTQNYDGTETHEQFAQSIGGTYVEYAS